MKEYIKEFKYILFHPVDGFDQMKEKKSGSFKLSALIALLWFIAATFERQFTHFRFNYFDTENTNVIYIFISTIVMFIFFCVANWALCTLFDGEGSIREIWIVSGYAILPFVVSVFLSALLSNILTVSEATFLNFITTAGLIWTGLLLLFGMMQIHRYDFKKTLFSILGSFIALALILFLVFLIILLFQQIFSFADSVYREIFYRI